MSSRMLWVAALISLVAMSLPAAVLGQVQSGELNGKVVDPDGLPLPGVTITLHEEATGYTRTAVTQADGAYNIINLRPGNFDVTVEMSGFKTINQTGLVLSAGAELTVNYDMELATIEEVVTVTAETPLVEVTNNRIGGTLATKEIDEIPSNFRNFTTLTQLVPGMTPSQSTSTFEGGGATANGAVGANNLFMIDGGYNNDDRLGSGPGAQVRVVLDVIGEYQVLASQYSAEYGGAAGAIINMVSKSGTNDLSGRVYSYYRNDSLYSRSAFLPEGEPKPDEQTIQAGVGIGGPIVQDKAHFYFNYERDDEKSGQNKKFPAEAAPIATDFVGYFHVRANNFFGRVDVQLNQDNILSGRWVMENAPSLGEGLPTNSDVLDAQAYESDHDQSINLSLTSVLGDTASNSFRFTRIDENLGSGSQTWFSDADSITFFKNLEFVGLNGRSQFDIGAAQSHPGYNAGPGGSGRLSDIRTYLFDDAVSYFVPNKGGDHNFKFGGGFSMNRVDPQTLVDSGTFEFESDIPYNPANPVTYPVQYSINLVPEGSNGFDTFIFDKRANLFAQDKWRVNDRLTLNLGVRWDYQKIVPNKSGDFAPRIGVAYDPTGDGRTVIRGGFGRFSLWTRVAVPVAVYQNQPASLNPSLSVADPNSPVLNPDLDTDSNGNPGIAKVSSAGEAALNALRDQVLAGGVYITEPILDSPDRAMPYQWGWSFGIQHELAPDWAVTVDYVANVTRDQIGRFDINEPVNGVRPGVDAFDPNAELIPAGPGRDTNFRRVRQYQTNSDLNGDYKSLQVALNKRFSDRYSIRSAYTLQRSHSVGSGTERSVWLDDNIRADYGRGPGDRTSVFTFSGTWNPVGAFTIGTLLSAQSGAATNETTGVDGNKDNDRNDRPIAGIDDTTKPIVSDTQTMNLVSYGGGSYTFAVPNGIEGPGYFGIDLSLRYNFDLGNNMGLGLFWDIFNLTNRTNLDGINSNRSSGSFNTSTNALFPRQMQLGARFTF